MHGNPSQEIQDINITDGLEGGRRGIFGKGSGKSERRTLVVMNPLGKQGPIEKTLSWVKKIYC